MSFDIDARLFLRIAFTSLAKQNMASSSSSSCSSDADVQMCDVEAGVFYLSVVVIEF